jgi:hypothetical protein
MQSSSKRTNCLAFAWGCFRKRGGFITFRKSHHGWWWHFMWSNDLKTWIHYSPREPNDDLASPPPTFDGIIKRLKVSDLF